MPHRQIRASETRRYDLYQFLLNQLTMHENDVQREINLRLDVAKNFADYTAAFERLRGSELGTSDAGKMSPASFNKVEARLFAKRALKAPGCAAKVTCTVSYTSPKGQNFYTRAIQSDFEQLQRALDEMRRIREARGTTQFLRARERSKMTASLRADVLRRDGFRCQMCGRSASDGVKLHVDHIVAVSNGGMTKRSNLQTLCEDCNLGKSNRF